ncbi:uncharacterized protein [Amphiura filiformis]|uniref:uncharacterized protein n=1 Tax=Amphiura filiformis TaxID=82378 RepID=UPI003B20C73D
MLEETKNLATEEMLDLLRVARHQKPPVVEQCAPQPETNIPNRLSPQQDTEKELIYRGAKITCRESMISILNLASRPDTTMATLSIVLDLIRLHLPEEAGDVEHLRSLYKFRQLCAESTQTRTVKHHHVCPKCCYLFSDGEDCCPTNTAGKTCGGQRWHYVGQRRQPSAFFIEMDAAHQIEQFFQDPAFVENVNQTHGSQDGAIRDVYDGSLYRDNYEFLQQENNISLLWHTDGVSIYNSADLQIWPMQAVINELPLRKRFSKKNVVLFGLWFGPSKPNMNCYLAPIVETLHEIYVKGFEVTMPNGEKSVCRVLALACTMDLPAMSAVKEVHQFNGSYGCGLCEHEGVLAQRKRGKCRVYPYQGNIQIRTHQRIVDQGKAALQSGCKQTVYGVKGLSVVMLIPKCDMATHFLLDHMHGVCLGVVKRQMQCWFDSLLKEKYCIKGNVDALNEVFLRIKPPSDIRRPPQSLHRKVNFKASEYMYFLLFYGLHVLKGCLPPLYFTHFAMLSRGVYLLMTDCVEMCDLDEADKLLAEWLKNLEKYYGPEQCTINAHNVGQHLVNSVRLGGPLYTHGCFGFESRCGDYSHMVTSTRNPAQQIVSRVSIAQDYKALEVNDSDTHPELRTLINRGKKRKSRDLTHGFVQGGATKLTTLKEAQKNALVQYDSSLQDVAQVHQYRRVERRGVVFEGHSKIDKVYCDQYVKYQHNEEELYGCIDLFLSARGHEVALIKPFKAMPQADLSQYTPDECLVKLGVGGVSLFNHITPVMKSENIHAVPLNSLLNKLVFLSGDKDRTWGNVIEVPLNLEHN